MSFGEEKAKPCPQCETLNEPSLPATVSATVYETKDKYRGKSHMKNQDRLMKTRMREHHDRYEVFEKIDKHGMDDARKFGWDKKAKKL